MLRAHECRISLETINNISEVDTQLHESSSFFIASRKDRGFFLQSLNRGAGSQSHTIKIVGILYIIELRLFRVYLQPILSLLMIALTEKSQFMYQ